MKRSLLCICILLFAAITLYAQKFELGLNAGMSHNTQLRGKTKYGWVDTAPLSGNSPAFSLKGLYNRKNFQLGLSIDYRQINFRQVWIQDPNIELFEAWPWANTINTGRLSYMPVSFFANKKMKLKKCEVYGGVSLGYGFLWVDKGFYAELPRKLTLDNGSNSGFNAGIQLGGNYSITSRMSINAEVGCQCIHFKPEKFDPSYTFSIPATLGFRYRLKPDTNKTH